MRETFVTEDLLNTLITLETLGNENYTKLASNARDSKSQELFGILAAQELKHKRIYEGFKNNLPGTETVDQDYLEYARLLLKKQIPIIGAEMVPEDFIEGFKLAMMLEKETIFFLHEVKGLLNEEQSSMVDPLIAEERKHLKYLMEYK